MKFWILTTCCLALAAVANGFGAGAPVGTCTSLTPNAAQHGAGPQTGAEPYTISFDQMTYTPGTALKRKFLPEQLPFHNFQVEHPLRHVHH